MKKTISILSAILMLMTLITPIAASDSVEASTENANAVFVAVRWAPNASIWSGDELVGSDERTFSYDSSIVSWGRNEFRMPGDLLYWTEFYLDVVPNSGESQEGNHWFAALDSNGKLWFDPDGHFHDSRYYRYADPMETVYQLDRARTDDNCKENPFARVDPITSNNTQGPYDFPLYNISEGVDTDSYANENPIYFMDPKTGRTFRLGYTDIIGHNPNTLVPDNSGSEIPESWDNGLPLEPFLDGWNGAGLTLQEPPWDYDGTGPAVNNYDVANYFLVDNGDWGFGEEWHSAVGGVGGRAATAIGPGQPNMVQFVFGDAIYRRGVNGVNNLVAGYDPNAGQGRWPHFFGDTRLNPVIAPSSAGRWTRYAAGSAVVDMGVPGTREAGDDFDVGTSVYRFPLHRDHFDGNPANNDFRYEAWPGAGIGDTAHVRAPWGIDGLFDYSIQATPNGTVTLAEGIYMAYAGSSASPNVSSNFVRLTNWTSGLMFSQENVPRFVQSGDVLILAEVLKGGCASPLYNISIETDLFEGQIPSVTTAAIRSPNDEVTYRSQTIQKSTVLGPKGDLFAVPACTFQNVKLDYREYLGIEIWADNGSSNMMYRLGNSVYNVVPHNSSDDYHEGEVSEIFIGADDSTHDNDIGLGEDSLTLTRSTNQIVLPLSDFYQQTASISLVGHPFQNILDDGSGVFDVNPNGFGAPVRFLDLNSARGGYGIINVYGCGEALYRDMDYLLPATAEGVGAFEISMGDIRLTDVNITRLDPLTGTSTVIKYHKDSVVAPGDADVNIYAGLGMFDMYNNIPCGNDLSAFYNPYYDETVFAHMTTNGFIGDWGPEYLWLDWRHLDPYDINNTIPMNYKYDTGEFIYSVDETYVAQNLNITNLQGDDSIANWANPYGTVNAGWTRLSDVEYLGEYYPCGSITSVTDQWYRTYPVGGITMGRNGDKRFMDMEVIPGDPGAIVDLSSELKVEQTTEVRVSFSEGNQLMEGYWDGPTWIPAEVGYVLLQGNGMFYDEAGQAHYLNNVLYELTPDRPEARFHFTPYRGNCLEIGDPGDLLEIHIFREKGGQRPAPPDGVYGDFFWEYHGNSDWTSARYTLGQTYVNRIPILEIPDEEKIPYPPMPSELRDSYDCYAKYQYQIEPEDLIVESSRLCITTLDQRFPNLVLKLYDADNENDVNDPANIPFSIPFDYDARNPENFHANIVNYNCHGGGIDFMAVAHSGNPQDLHKFIIQFNSDGTYYYWYWYEPPNPSGDPTSPQIPNALDENDYIIGQEWTQGFPIPPSENVKRTPVIVEDKATLEDNDCSQAKGLCDACEVDGMRPLGDVTGVPGYPLRSDYYGVFDGTTGYITSYGIPTYVSGYGQLTMSDEGGRCLALAKPIDGSTHLMIRIYSTMAVFDYNSTISHPDMTDGAPYFVYDKMWGGGPEQGIDYCGTLDMKVYPPDPYVNFAEFHVVDHALQFSNVHYTAGFNAGSYVGPLSPLDVPTPQIQAPYNPILRYVPTEFRCYPGGQTHTGRVSGQVWGNSGGPFGWNAYPAIWSRQINEDLAYEQYGKLGTEFFPLTDYGFYFIVKDGDGRHLSFDPNWDPDRRMIRMEVTGPFAVPKILDRDTGSVVTKYEYNSMTQVPIQYDWSGKIVIDETNWQDYEKVWVDQDFNGGFGADPYTQWGGIPNENAQYRKKNGYVDLLDNLNFSSVGWMNPIGSGRHENTDNLIVIDEIIPWQPGKILIYVTLYDGTFKMYQDCCTAPPTDGVDVHALGIEYTISESDEVRHVPLGIDNTLEVVITEDQPYWTNIANASTYCNDALVYVWQDRGVQMLNQDYFRGAGDGWVTNPPGSSRFYYGRGDGNAAQYDTTWDDQPIDINGDNKVTFEDRETEIVGAYDIATNTWVGGYVDARTFQRNNGLYVFELTEENMCQVVDSGLDFGGEEGIGDEPDHIISDKELLPLYITAYKYGDDNNDRAFSPFWDPSPLQDTYDEDNPESNRMRYSHEVYLAGQVAVSVEPEDDLIVSLATPQKLTAGITPELISPDTPLTIEVKDSNGSPVDLSFGMADIDGELTVEDNDIWNYLFKDPHPDNKFYYGWDASLPQYYFVRTDLHNKDEEIVNNEELYSVRTIDPLDCETSLAIPFRPIEIDFSRKADGRYVFRGFCANDITSWKGEPGSAEEEEWMLQHQFIVYVYTPDRKHRGSLIVPIESPMVTYEVLNVEDETETFYSTPGDPDFVMTAADNRIYKVKVTVMDAEGRLVKGVTKGVSVCGGGVKNTARFTPFVTRPASFEFEFDPCEGAPCGQKLYPHIGFDFDASGNKDGYMNAIDPGNNEFHQFGGFNITSDIEYQICRSRVTSGYVEYNTSCYWYRDNNTWETDYTNPNDPTMKGWAINMLIPPNLQFMTTGSTEPLVRGWGLGNIYNYDWFGGALFADVDANGLLDYHDALGLDVNAQTEFYVWAEDVFDLGGLVGDNKYVNNKNEADVAGYPPRDRTDPRELHRRIRYTISNDQTFYLDWEAWPDRTAAVRAPRIVVLDASDVDLAEYSKEFLNTGNYDLVYNVPNHMTCLVYPADERDVPMHEDGYVMLVGNQHEEVIYGRTKKSDYDANATTTTIHFTPTGTGEATVRMYYLSQNKWHTPDFDCCDDKQIMMTHPEFYSVLAQKLDVGKGLLVEVKTLEPLTPKASSILYITVSEVGTLHPVPGAKVTVSGAGVDVSKNTNGKGEVEIEVSPATTGFITIKATNEDYRMGETKILVGSDNTPPSLFVDVVPPVTNQNEITITGTVTKGAQVTINGKAATTKADGTFSGKVTLQPGKNPITVVAKDGSGNTVSKVVYVTLDQEGPSVMIDKVSALYNETEFDLKGRVEPGCTVVIKSGGSIVAEAVVIHDRWQANGLKLKPAPSRNEFTVEATDAAGNKTISQPIEVENVERLTVVLKAGTAAATLNGKAITLKEAVTGTTFMAPVDVFEHLKAQKPVVNMATGQVEIQLNGSKINLTIGSTDVTVDGAAAKIIAAPVMGTATVKVPVMDVAKKLGCQTTTDDNGALHITFDRH
ncbi:MAG TPA: stalk domain-containing protein [Caldisericia bacterium]|nr:stalk domain-containing protein [Caldisericia bacterium]HPF48816.1 stalk domain-containing protein [Caldisericia bacterium]HPI84260.1 stalk domain-containing protein [Caldisericia bacterium]HPQ93438.1 stalk domain-containing protein [Caldisericia bacterium]HRV74896.1 stalk domain-containing protein [Caldisericia bacterium]